MKKESFKNKGEIIIYQDKQGENAVDVRLEKDTIWANLNQISEIFGRDKSVISRHISNILKEKELDKKQTVAKNATVQIEGKKSVRREIEYYNLDMNKSAMILARIEEGLKEDVNKVFDKLGLSTTEAITLFL